MTDRKDAVRAPSQSATVRFLSAALGAAIAVAGLAWGADLYRTLGLNFLAEQFLAAVFGLGLALVFITCPIRRGARRTSLPWYDAALAAVGFATSAYIAWAYPDLLEQFFAKPVDGIVASWILFLLSVEGLRRTAGWSLVVIVIVFTLYALVGHMVPGALETREVEINNMMIYLGIDSSGLFGLVMLVGVTVVIPFIFFGQLLSASGGSSFFNELSVGLMGRYRGGAAKIAILASSLFGSISGIVVSNILATGVITIPLMKKSGFSARQAAAIEATASNGGQMMPPIMGAVAFLMADFLQVDYTDVAIAALVPSVLYYVALFIQADLEAAKLGIRRVPASEIPRLLGVVLRGWFFILPFAVLIYALFWMNREPENAAIFTCAVVLAIGLAVGYAGRRMSLRDVWTCVVQTGIASVDILMIAAAAGFIIGILQLTGLGFALTLFLTSIGAGSVLALLLIASVMCIVLGMGMPTLGVYVLLAVLVAPGLVEVGITPLAAHMFILYLGLMSMVTPPVAIAAFFAANLAGAEPMRTGFTAMRFSWTAYIVPFLFVFSPALLLRNPSVFDTGLAIMTAIAGVWIVSAGMIGYWLRPMTWSVRIATMVGGFMLLIPHEIGAWAVWTDLAGLALSLVVIGYEVIGSRRDRAVALVASE